MDKKEQDLNATQEGGCLCGKIRYRVKGPPLHTEYCHCSMCRRAGGAPVVAWADYPHDRLTWLQGEPTLYRSSPSAQRGFCPTCGSSLLFQWNGTDFLSITIGTLDHPERIAPQGHIYHADRVPWFQIADDLPRHAVSPSKKD